MSAKNLTAFIFARGGSKGVQDKNIRMVGGKPLIAYSIACALQSPHIAHVVVSTDSKDIAQIAQDHGADVLMRPDELAADDTSEILAWRHAIDSSPETFNDHEQSLFISLPATSPLRAPEDIEAGLARFQKGDCDIVFGITPARNNPYLSMAVIDENDLIQIAMAGSKAARRQDVPATYDITGCVYVTNPEYIMRTERLIDGRVGYVEIPHERALDIDTEHDLHLADLLLMQPFKGDGSS